MKRKTLLSYLFILVLAANSVVFAQNDEYYRPDSLKGKSEPKEVSPIEKKELTEKKKVADFKQRPFADRLRAGGSFGFSFGTVTSLNLSPLIGYEVTKNFVAAAGLTGMYFDSKLSGVKSFYYGQRTVLMYTILPVVNLVGEMEFLNVEADTFTKYDARKWIASPMLGASLSQATGGRLIKAVHFTLLYNINYNNQVDDYGANISPYGRIFNQPLVFRVTFL